MTRGPGRPVPTEDCLVRIDGIDRIVPHGLTIAAALAHCGMPAARRSALGDLRHAFCGMGICGECRVTIDGQAHRLGCLVACEPGMEVERDD